MTEQDRRELRELLDALAWAGAYLLVGIGFTAPFWLPASWILH